MAYKVTAPLVLAHDQIGKVRHHYQGAVIPWLNDDQAGHFQGLGLVESVDADETPAPRHGAPSGAQPKKTATQGAWAEYAISKGADRAEAEAATRDELVAIYGDK